MAVNGNREREGCAIGERDVNADGTAERYLRPANVALPQPGGNAATLLLLNSYIAGVRKGPGTAMPVPAAE